MEMRLGYKDGAVKSGTGGRVRLWPVYLCFIILGATVPFAKPEVKATTVLVSMLAAALIAALAINLLVMLFNASNRALLEEDSQFAREAVGTGMLFMIPFTVLAVLAQFVMGWNGIMPFASAAIMTAAATAGTEVVKKGAQGMKNVMIPTLVALVLSTAWMLLVGILP